jgi:hypothetical protein
MILNFEQALYFVQAASNLGNVPESQVSGICPVCNKPMKKNDHGDHVVYDPSTENDGDVVVIVACNGHRVLDPNICGMPDPEWVEWTKRTPRSESVPGETAPIKKPKPKTPQGGGLTPRDATPV